MTLPLDAYGAVDLSALSRPAPVAPTAGQTSSGPLVLDVTEETFEQEVLIRSATVPVVIDLWAEWCGPCKQLSPILEKLAAADDGRWVLAKIDVDANQSIAAAFGVQGIPAVFAAIGGRPLALFQGALPEADVRRVIDEMLRVAAENGVVGTVHTDETAASNGSDDAAAAPEPEPDPYADAERALAAGDLDTAGGIFRDLLAEAPGDGFARSGLAQVELLRRLDGVDPTRAEAAANAAPGDIAAQQTAADVAVATGRLSDGFDRLIAAIKAADPSQREALRAHLLELFDLVGVTDPEVVRARTALANALF